MSGLSLALTEEMLAGALSAQIGPVTNVALLRPPSTGTVCGLASVAFESYLDAHRAVRTLHGGSMLNSTIQLALDPDGAKATDVLAKVEATMSGGRPPTALAPVSAAVPAAAAGAQAAMDPSIAHFYAHKAALEASSALPDEAAKYAAYQQT